MPENLISLMKLETLTANLHPPLRCLDFHVIDVNLETMNINPHRWYKAEYFGLMILLEGSAYYSIGDHEYQISKGDIMFCVPMEIFKVLYISPDIQAKQIFFSIDMISEAGFNYRSNDIIKSFSNNPSYIIRHQESLFGRLLFHMSELGRLNDSTYPNYYAEELIWHHFSLLMYEVDVFNRESMQQAKNSSREEELTTSFFGLVRDHFKAHHDVQFYADSLHVSRKYLSRIVKKTMAKSPKDIINQVLLIEAKILLRSSKSNVNEVSRCLEFSDPAIFSKFFKKHTGTRPSEYKMNDIF